jgi:hypothetical protein
MKKHWRVIAVLVRPAVLYMRNVEAVVCLRVPSAETVHRILAKDVIECLYYTSLGELVINVEPM